MSCMDELKGTNEYCGEEVIVKWILVLTGEFKKYEVINFLEDNTKYAKSTIRKFYYANSGRSFFVSNNTYQEMAKAVYDYQGKDIYKEQQRKRIENEEKVKRIVSLKEQQFTKESSEFFKYVSTSPGVYVLECCDEEFRPIGVKVGSTGNFFERFKTVNSKIPNSAFSWGTRIYRPLAYFPTIGENFDISRAYAYKLESSLHIFMQRFKDFEHVGNDHFMFLYDKHFRLYELLEDEETIKDLYAMVEDFNDNFSLQQSILETYTKFRYL